MAMPNNNKRAKNTFFAIQLVFIRIECWHFNFIKVKRYELISVECCFCLRSRNCCTLNCHIPFWVGHWLYVYTLWCSIVLGFVRFNSAWWISYTNWDKSGPSDSPTKPVQFRLYSKWKASTAIKKKRKKKDPSAIH